MPDDDSNWNEQTLIMTKCQAPVMLICMIKDEERSSGIEIWLMRLCN